MMNRKCFKKSTKVYQKVDGEWKYVGTFASLVASAEILKLLRKENNILKKDKNLLSEEIKELKRKLTGKNQTIKNFQEKEEKRYGQICGGNRRYESNAEYHR